MFHVDAVQDTTYRIGYNHHFTRGGITIYPENSEKIISHGLSFRNVYQFTMDDRDLIEHQFSLEYQAIMSNTSELELQGTRQKSNLLFPFGFTEGEPLPAGAYTFYFLEAQYKSDKRKLFSFEVGMQYGEFYNGNRTEYSLNANFRARPWGSFGIDFVNNFLEFPAPYEDETLTLMGSRVEFNFSRDLFWTTFIQYNTQADNFNVNSRFQWRFQPLSDIFLVYTDNYILDGWIADSRSIVLKVNYWLNI
jgi:hypothetical protein